MKNTTPDGTTVDTTDDAGYTWVTVQHDDWHNGAKVRVGVIDLVGNFCPTGAATWVAFGPEVLRVIAGLLEEEDR